jgi:hypothetical protein
LDLSRDPGIEADISPLTEGAFDVTLTTQRPALWVWLELAEADAKCSDNFFHLRPGAPLTVHLCPAEKLSAEDLQQQLLVRSLVDTY